MNSACAAVQMEAPYTGAAMKATYNSEAAVKSTHYAEATGKAVNCICCHMACGGGERVIHMKMCIQNYEVTSDAHIIFMYTSSCFENTKVSKYIHAIVYLNQTRVFYSRNLVRIKVTRNLL